MLQRRIEETNSNINLFQMQVMSDLKGEMYHEPRIQSHQSMRSELVVMHIMNLQETLHHPV